MEIKPGSIFLDYEVLEEIGRGGFGAVFKGKKIHSEPPFFVAIKVLHQIHAGHEKNVRRFHREARLARKLSHPNVVAILDDGVIEDIHYIIMEFAEGKNLLLWMIEGDSETSVYESNTLSMTRSDLAEPSASNQDIQDAQTVVLDKAFVPGTFPAGSAETAIPLMKQCADVLKSAEEAGLVHRDIKPENILVRKSQDGTLQVKILDFGLAKNFVDESVQLSSAGQAIGTPAYMSPEQFKGDSLDIRSDLYSLGATFYTFVTGQKPFKGPGLREFMHQVIMENPMPASQANPSVSENFSRILLRLMHKDPSKRYQHPNELLQDLNRSASVQDTAKQKTWGWTGLKSIFQKE
ncbi:MAG: serine/threonine protein kinase [Candidatus Aureabacteria bacterium]|nr:serine/threonine protein kinase [Candidatus Auribacterota bacterium]